MENTYTAKNAPDKEQYWQENTSQKWYYRPIL